MRFLLKVGCATKIVQFFASVPMLACCIALMVKFSVFQVARNIIVIWGVGGTNIYFIMEDRTM